MPMGKAYSLEKDVLVIHRELTQLDLFVRDFVEVLRKHIAYLIVSGFVSIAAGRSRGTEDVDVLIPAVDSATFTLLFEELSGRGFWCYQGDTAKGVYPYIQELAHIRFARANQVFPNVECIPITSEKKAQYFEFRHPQKMRIKDFEFNIPPLEFEILYKEIILGGEKDLADAKHLRTVFSDILKRERFKEFEPVVRSHGH